MIKSSRSSIQHEEVLKIGAAEKEGGGGGGGCSANVEEGGGMWFCKRDRRLTALFLPSFDSTIIRNKIRPHSLVVSTFLHRPSHFAADAAVFAALFFRGAQLLNAAHARQRLLI